MFLRLSRRVCTATIDGASPPQRRQYAMGGISARTVLSPIRSLPAYMSCTSSGMVGRAACSASIKIRRRSPTAGAGNSCCSIVMSSKPASACKDSTGSNNSCPAQACAKAWASSCNNAKPLMSHPSFKNRCKRRDITSTRLGIMRSKAEFSSACTAVSCWFIAAPCELGLCPAFACAVTVARVTLSNIRAAIYVSATEMSLG